MKQDSLPFRAATFPCAAPRHSGDTATRQCGDVASQQPLQESVAVSDSSLPIFYPSQIFPSIVQREGR